MCHMSYGHDSIGKFSILEYYEIKWLKLAPCFFWIVFEKIGNYDVSHQIMTIRYSLIFNYKFNGLIFYHLFSS